MRPPEVESPEAREIREDIEARRREIEQTIADVYKKLADDIAAGIVDVREKDARLKDVFVPLFRQMYLEEQGEVLRDDDRKMKDGWNRFSDYVSKATDLYEDEIGYSQLRSLASLAYAVEATKRDVHEASLVPLKENNAALERGELDDEAYDHAQAAAFKAAVDSHPRDAIALKRAELARIEELHVAGTLTDTQYARLEKDRKRWLSPQFLREQLHFDLPEGFTIEQVPPADMRAHPVWR
ncbi:MAG TPA: hypothetical protein VJB16_07500 [archaeon]|nr:hypothetical protein [archaeon]